MVRLAFRRLLITGTLFTIAILLILLDLRYPRLALLNVLAVSVDLATGSRVLRFIAASIVAAAVALW